MRPSKTLLPSPCRSANLVLGLGSLRLHTDRVAPNVRKSLTMGSTSRGALPRYVQTEGESGRRDWYNVGNWIEVSREELPLSTLTNTKRVVFDPAAIRKRFPSLAIQLHGRDVVFFDNPGGTQVTQSCIDAITAYLTSSNANTHGAFLTSQRTDEVLSAARAAMADLLNATDPREIVFGPNMTTLTFPLRRAIRRTLKRGAEILVNALDHDANVAPWLALEEERG